MKSWYVGTSGFTLQNFYEDTVPSALRLSYYAKFFPTVEINSTFYHYPRISTVQSWKQRVPTDFIFSFKVNKNLTHLKEIVDHEAMAKWFEAFSSFQNDSHQHLMLFQFPASKKFKKDELEKLLEAVPKYFRYAFEFRHQSWFNDETFKMIDESGATVVYSDGLSNSKGDQIWPQFDLTSSKFNYIRMHGSQRLYASSYSDNELHQLAELIQKKETPVYVYFNNDALGHAAENALRLNQFLKEK